MGDNPNNDVLVTSPPTDGVSSITWSPKANIFVATSWDNQVSAKTNLIYKRDCE